MIIDIIFLSSYNIIIIYIICHLDTPNVSRYVAELLCVFILPDFSMCVSYFTFSAKIHFCG